MDEPLPTVEQLDLVRELIQDFDGRTTDPPASAEDLAMVLRQLAEISGMLLGLQGVVQGLIQRQAEDHQQLHRLEARLQKFTSRELGGDP